MQQQWTAIIQPPTVHTHTDCCWMPMKANVGSSSLLVGNDGDQQGNGHPEWKLLLPELAVDVWYPPGILSVKAHPLHLVLEPGSHVFACRWNREVQIKEKSGSSVGVTWIRKGAMTHTRSAQLAVLLLLTSIYVHAPGMESEGEQVLKAWGRTHYGVQAFLPFLTLLKGGELTPGGSNTKWLQHLAIKENLIASSLKRVGEV